MADFSKDLKVSLTGNVYCYLYMKPENLDKLRWLHKKLAGTIYDDFVKVASRVCMYVQPSVMYAAIYEYLPELLEKDE